MLDKLKALWFGDTGSRRLTEFTPDPAMAVAALLLEASEVDQETPPEEQALVRTLLHQRYGLDPDHTEALLADARRVRKQAGDLWPFTHAIQHTYTPEQKRDLLIMVWQVLLADRRLDPYEEQWARRLPEMLAVNPSVNIEAKLRAKAIMAGIPVGGAAKPGAAS
jgi:uncharacterized tellurite resistance protein B-like protein